MYSAKLIRYKYSGQFPKCWVVGCLCCPLTDGHNVPVDGVGGDFEVEGGGAFTDAAGRVVMGAVARAVVAAELASIRNRHAT
jgi:hypothetical protein